MTELEEWEWDQVALMRVKRLLLNNIIVHRGEGAEWFWLECKESPST